MMKQKLLLLLVMLVNVTCMSAQRSYTFNATALNVDGLPKSILSFEINPDGKEEAGAAELCGILANSGWDIVGFSEDFNFHNNLVAAPASNYYNFGEHGGKVSGLSNSTDGLGFACAKRFTMGGGTRVAWNDHYGETDHGADGLINKGFRVYNVTFASGVVVDVYVLHMDAEDSADDISARKKQLTQLATYIKNNHNNRPVIILGDTNCRYTREQLKTGFIDVINADSRLTINDAWVELIWGGKYPTYGAGSMMTDAYGMQKGEVVDKVFYINTTESNLKLKANSYLHDASVTVSDHKPVVFNFTLTDPNATPLTDAEKENNWTLEESVAGNQKPTWEGEQVVSGTTYYMMNVGTGEYAKVGGTWDTQAVSGNAGTPITVTALSNEKYALQSLGNSRGNYMTSAEYPYMDGMESEAHEWTLTPIATSSGSCQYYIEGGNGVLTTTTEIGKPLKTVAKNTSDENQKWVFLTDDRIRTEMAKANADYPFNFTPLLKSADFDGMEHAAGYASGWTGFSFGGADNGGNPANYNHAAVANTTNAVSVSHSLGSLPKGTYDVSFEGFYRSRYRPSGLFKQEQDETCDAMVSFGSTNISVKQNLFTTIGTEIKEVAAIFRDNDTYHTSSQITLSDATTVTLSVSKPKTSSTAKAAWICLDNFRLIYYGTGEVAIDPYKEYKDKVCTKVNETYTKVMALNAAGQAAYDITTVISRYNNDQITTGADAQALCDVVDAAYANAYAAHRAKEVQDVVDAMGENGGDMTTLIINPSFETGDLTGWTTAGGGWDVGVQPNSNATFTTNGCDGAYLFNSYGGDNDHTAHIEQTVTGIPNGLYELKVDVTSFADRYVYIFGNGYNDKVATTNDKDKFHEATLYFLVEDGSANIGVVGGNKGGGTTFVHYWPEQGCFFKADNFRLKYVCDVPHGRLKLALDEANASKLDAYGKAVLDLSSYQSAYDNKSLATDGKAEVKAVYNALQAASKAQRTANADMTWAITNPNFETGDYTGWTCSTGGDTKVASQEHGTYTIAGTDGRYLFNTWNNGTAQALTQTVAGIPNGTYKLTAMVAGDAGQNIKLTANGVTTTIATSTNGAGSGVFPDVTCEVTDGTLGIEVIGVNDVWYKADNFRLTYLGHNLTLDETGDAGSVYDWYTSVTVNRTIKPNTWSTFVVPFSMTKPAGWEVKELTSSTMNGDNITLTFSDADAIEAGVPYMVRVASDVSKIEVENVTVNTALNDAIADHIDFVGVYANGYVPEGSFFISSNKFYRAADNTNTMKAFRAYLQPKDGANIKAVGYSFDDVDATFIEGVETAETAVPVAVYGADGALRAGLQKGLNIVKMSDGKVKKVFVK